jgi:ATP-binding protein involved in chromosome partitioning
MIPSDAILNALRAVIDPDFQQDIVTLGFVKELEIQDGRVSFTIELTTPACPIRDRFKAQAEEVVRRLPGVKEVRVTMTARERPQRKLENGSGLAQTASILAVTSCKGGVGKSTVAAMLAVNLARRGFRTGLLDADIFGPSAPTLFNLHETGVRNTPSGYLAPRTWEHLQVMSFGFMLGDQPAVMRGPMVSNIVQQLLHQVEWGELDYLVIDFPPGTGDVQLTISQSVQVDAAVIVTTPHELSLADVRKGIQMFAKVDVPVIGVIENMAYFECGGCGQRHEIFGPAGAGVLRERFGLETLAVLPVRPAISGRIDAIATAPEAAEATDAVIRALGRQALARPERPQAKATPTHIELHWSDGRVERVSNRALRLACSCALCVDEMSREPVLDPATVPDDIHALELWTIGNYALGVSWSDGHATGYFPFGTIQELAAEGG